MKRALRKNDRADERPRWIARPPGPFVFMVACSLCGPIVGCFDWRILGIFLSPPTHHPVSLLLPVATASSPIAQVPFKLPDGAVLEGVRLLKVHGHLRL